MKMNDEILGELIKEVIGSDAISLVIYIKNKEDVSEFKIAEVLGININLIRNMLYRLSNHSLVSSIRKKDKKKGWYIYYWTFNMQQAAELIISNKKKKAEQMKHMLGRMINETFFVCPHDGLTMTYETALEHGFKCPEDGELMKQKDNSLDMERLKREIEKLEIDISSGVEVEKRPVRKERHKKKIEKKVRKSAKKMARKILKKKIRRKIAKIKSKIKKIKKT